MTQKPECKTVKDKRIIWEFTYGVFPYYQYAKAYHFKNNKRKPPVPKIFYCNNCARVWQEEYNSYRREFSSDYLGGWIQCWAEANRVCYECPPTPNINDTQV